MASTELVEAARTCTLHVDAMWKQRASERVCVRATIRAAEMARIQ